MLPSANSFSGLCLEWTLTPIWSTWKHRTSVEVSGRWSLAGVPERPCPNALLSLALVHWRILHGQPCGPTSLFSDVS